MLPPSFWDDPLRGDLAEAVGKLPAPTGELVRFAREATLDGLWAWIREDPRPATLRLYFAWAANLRAPNLARAMQRAAADVARTSTESPPGHLARLPGGLATYRRYVAAVRLELRRQEASLDLWARSTGLLTHEGHGLTGHDPLAGWAPGFKADGILPAQRATYRAAGQRALGILAEADRKNKARRSRAGDGVDVVGEFTVDDPKLQARIDALLLDQVKGIDETTAEALRGILGGEGTIADKAAAINAYWDQASLARGITIAATEMARASAAAELDTYRENGVEMVEFSGGYSGDICDEFVGEQYPADSNEVEDIIPVHPNCTHYWAPVIPDSWGLPTVPWAGGGIEPIDLEQLGASTDEEIQQYVEGLPGYVAPSITEAPAPVAATVPTYEAGDAIGYYRALLEAGQSAEDALAATAAAYEAIEGSPLPTADFLELVTAQGLAAPEVKASFKGVAFPRDPAKAAKETFKRANAVATNAMQTGPGYVSKASGENALVSSNSYRGQFHPLGSVDPGLIQLDRASVHDPIKRWFATDPALRDAETGLRRQAHYRSEAKALEAARLYGIDPANIHVHYGRQGGKIVSVWYFDRPTTVREEARDALRTVFHENIHGVMPDISERTLREWNYGTEWGRAIEEAFTEAEARQDLPAFIELIGIDDPTLAAGDLAMSYDNEVDALRDMARYLVDHHLVGDRDVEALIRAGARETQATRVEWLTNDVVKATGLDKDGLMANYGMNATQADDYAYSARATVGNAIQDGFRLASSRAEAANIGQVIAKAVDDVVGQLTEAGFTTRVAREARRFLTWWRAGLAELRERAATASQHSGVMVGFWLPLELAEQLAVPGGEPPSEMHLTLAYLGKAADIMPNPIKDAPRLTKAVLAFARKAKPLTGRLAGIGRFTTVPEGQPHAVYASVDAPGLDELRVELSQALTSAGFPPDATHGFTPHVTLAYVAAGDPSPCDTVPPLELRLDTLTVAIGGRRVPVPLGGTT